MKVSIIIPQLGREEGLKRCLASIAALTIDQDEIEVLIMEGPITVPLKVKHGYENSKGEMIVYAANDMYFEPEALALAVAECQKTKGLVAFAGHEIYPDEGNICEHFIIHREMIPLLHKGEIFDTDFHHAGCDNWLWAQAKKLGKASRCADAIVHHLHFSTGAPKDEVYAKGWSKVEADRAILKEKLATLNGSN